MILNCKIEYLKHLSDVHSTDHTMEPVGKLNAIYRSERTYNGWPLDLAKSALQKYCRRGELDKALFAMFEMDLFSFLKHPASEGIRTNMIHRLMIIYMEDVGLGNVDIWPEVAKDIGTALKCREQRGGQPIYSDKFSEMRIRESQALAHAVYLMCRSYKSRDCSHYKYAYIVYPATEDKPHRIPSIDQELEASFPLTLQFAYSVGDEKVKEHGNRFLAALAAGSATAVHHADRITDAKCGKHYGSTNGAFLVFDLLRFFITNMKREADRFFLRKRLDIAIEWFKELFPVKDAFLCWMLVILMVLRVQNKAGFTQNAIDEVDTQDLLSRIQANLDEQTFEVDDYAKDMHTRAGKLKGRGYAFFVEHSAVVEPEDPLVNHRLKSYYNANKLGVPPPADPVSSQPEEVAPPVEEDFVMPDRESELKIITRVQLVTSSSHQDTFIAEVNGLRLFVKGPFLSRSAPELACQIAELKERLGIPAIPLQMVRMYPDALESGLGTRLQCNKEKKYPYLVAPCKLTDPIIPLERRSSSKWPMTDVIDYDRVKSVRRVDTSNRDEAEQMLEVMIFRALLGVLDNSVRNFMYVVAEKTVYGVDEDAAGGAFVNRMKESDKANLRAALERKKDHYEGLMAKWVEELGDIVVNKASTVAELVDL